MSGESETVVLAASFLRALPADVLGELAARSVAIPVPAGMFVYEPELAVVQQGLLRAFVADSAARQVTVSYIRYPGAIGLAHLAGRGFPVAFQAVTDCQLVQLEAPRLTELVDQYPRIGWSATREVTSRLDELLAETTRIAFGSMRQRLAFHVLNLTCDESGGPSRTVRQRDLALAVGTVGEVIRRTVIQLQAAGLLSATREGVVVVDRAGLRRIADSHV